MNGVTIALLAQILIGLSLVFDKLLLRDKISQSVLTYVFWMGLLSGSVLVLLPFGVPVLSPKLLLLGLAAGASFFFGLLAYYKALKAGEASQTLAIIGGFAPIATLVFSEFLLSANLGFGEYLAFSFLAAGGFLLFLSEPLQFRKIALWVVAASLLLGLSNVLSKEIFNLTGFIGGFILSKTGTLATALTLLLFPAWRKRIAGESRASRLRHRLLYLGNRALAGLASLAVFYAISLSHPALIESLSGIRYLVIFALVWLVTKIRPDLLQEVFAGWRLYLKIAATLAVILGLALLGIQASAPVKAVPADIFWGATFSQFASSQLGLDWKANYRAVLDELKPDGLRLIAYWEWIEPEDDKWNFDDLDWQMAQAQKAGVPVILTVGQKVPRWPECHIPAWAQEMQKSNIKNQNDRYTDELLEYIGTMVKRYRDYPNLLYWQVENEPFLLFGECPHSFVVQTLDEEIALVRFLDPAHPVLTTDGGEAGDWYRAAKRGDVFGTTLYRKVHSPFLGYFTYPLPPGFYLWKENVVQWLTGKPEQKFIVIELGLEPWLEEGLSKTTPEEQSQFFNLKDFEDSVEYAKATGFDTYYLWGTEWWYWLKTVHGDPRFWDMAKSVIQSGPN